MSVAVSLRWGGVKAPPIIGSEVPVMRNGVIKGYNKDNTANVKFGNKPGRPHKVPFEHILNDSQPATPPPLPFVALKTLPPMEPLLRLEEKKGKGGLFWTLALAALGGIGLGVSHALGHRILEMVWPYIQVLSPYAV